MKSLLLTLAFVCALATPALAGDRVETVKAQTRGGGQGIALIRCADGWVPVSTACPNTSHNAAATPSPIPGPESMDPAKHTKADESGSAQSAQTSENQVTMR